MRAFPLLILLALLCGCIGADGGQATTTTEQPVVVTSTSTTTTTEQPLETPVLTDTAENSENISCDLEAEQIISLLGKANHCSADSDCMATNEFYRCKVTKCYGYISNKADTTQLKKSLAIYDLNCPTRKCVTQCTTPPTQGELKCTNGRCTGPRPQISPPKT